MRPTVLAIVCMLLVATAAYGVTGLEATDSSGGIDPGHTPRTPCTTDCPEGAIIEGEPACGDGYVDVYNGGCNSNPPVYQPITLNATICGEGGTFMLDTFTRDTDWYEFTLTEETEIEFCLCPDFTATLALVDGQAGCNPPQTIRLLEVPYLEQVCFAEVLAPGTYWLFVASLYFDGLPCGAEYVATATVTATPVDDASWGTVKALYR